MRDPHRFHEEIEERFPGLKIHNIGLIAAVLGQLENGKETREKRLHRPVFF